MTNAELREQRVDRSDLNASTPTPIAQTGRANVVFATRDDERKSSKPIDDVAVSARPVEALQELL